MTRFALCVILGLSALASTGRAQVLRPASAGGAATTLAAPFAFASYLEPIAATQSKLCCLVEVLGDGKFVVRTVHGQTGKDQDVRLFEFSVKVIQGSGLEAGKTYRCVCQSFAPRKVEGSFDRFLLVGWAGAESGRLGVEPLDLVSMQNGRFAAYVDSEPNTIYVQALLPTRQKDIRGGASSAERAYMNLATALTKDVPSSVVRQVTSMWARVGPNYMDCSIEGSSAYEWIREHVGAVLAEASRNTAVERFRIGGLLATWDRPKRALAYLRELPKIMEELSRKGANKTWHSCPVWTSCRVWIQIKSLTWFSNHRCSASWRWTLALGSPHWRISERCSNS
jgi:hypothetical protein